ncbi:iron transporter FeoA [endosymbiont 'TC1' of Trimyema compressum]|uniref:FeoA family protein n=1 Tax=endosymbiont 'TC1' of Trimyema compressum TaxID=243899 RepID=UPI0007F04FE8|nr:FeoA domain-containing protein [endosymbiont 'TC1' of Trimyema compressum]AMP20288.1 iron transporter FeoA [endosymbiont 'TC1' of Trimyema compressum]
MKDFKIGEKGTIIRILGDGHIKRRIFDMVLTPGTEVTMRKTAPLKDPIELTVRHYELSIRKSEASTIILETEGEA